MAPNRIEIDMTLTNELPAPKVFPIDAATGLLPVPDRRPITVIGTDAVRAGFDANCLRQAINSASAPGVTQVVLNPDAHSGYGAPIGCVMVSPTPFIRARWASTSSAQ